MCSQPIEFIYPMYASFPSKMANVLQRVNTCYALAATGKLNVHVIYPDFRRLTAEDILRYYGLTPIPQLHFHPVMPWGGGQRIFQKIRSRGVVISAIIFVLKNKLLHQKVVLFGRDAQYLYSMLRSVKSLGCPIIFETHGFEALVHSKRHKLENSSIQQRYIEREKFVLRHANALIATTVNMKQILVKEFSISEERIFVAPNAARDLIGIDTDDGDYPPKGATFLVMYTGNSFLPEKYNLYDIIDAVSYTSDDITILFVGGNKMEEIESLREYAQHQQVSERIRFAGYVSPIETRRLQKYSDILLLHSQDDDLEIDQFTSPIKMFEYMAAAKPILAPNTRTIREVLHHSENAWLYEPGDPGALAEGIIHLKSNPELCQLLGQQARQDFLNHYTWQKRAEHIVDAVTMVLDN